MAPRTPAAREGGQILVLFVLSMIVILAVSALLVDGAGQLVTRRRLQNAGDAAALAGANVIHAAGSAHLCSTAVGPPPGAPRSDIVAAVMGSLASNYASLSASDVTITCPDGWQNQAVRVDLRLQAANIFGAAIGFGAPTVATTSTALNGQIAGSTYSVVLLDPSNPSWPNQRRGCPSFLISGGPVLEFGGSVQVNSTCSASDGGAIGTNGNSATVSFAPNRFLGVVGGYSPGPLTITPSPVLGVTPLEDPLYDIEAINYAAMPLRSSSRLVLNNTTQVLQPGVYQGGIQLRNTSIALLRPGIYVLDGGGLDVGAQASICSITATSSATDCGSATFAANCPDTACGILLFNRGSASGAGAMGQITIGAGSTMRLRAYDDRAMANVGFEYRNILVWQDGAPAPSSSYAQPTVLLNGGGSVEIAGTVYAPSAKVLMGGGSGGGGGDINLTLQFISWDLEMSGNSRFNFIYSDVDFARPKDYGLIQ